MLNAIYSAPSHPSASGGDCGCGKGVLEVCCHVTLRCAIFTNQHYRSRGSYDFTTSLSTGSAGYKHQSSPRLLRNSGGPVFTKHLSQKPMTWMSWRSGKKQGSIAFVIQACVCHLGVLTAFPKTTTVTTSRITMTSRS